MQEDDSSPFFSTSSCGGRRDLIFNILAIAPSLIFIIVIFAVGFQSTPPDSFCAATLGGECISMFGVKDSFTTNFDVFGEGVGCSNTQTCAVAVADRNETHFFNEIEAASLSAANASSSSSSSSSTSSKRQQFWTTVPYTTALSQETNVSRAFKFCRFLPGLSAGQSVATIVIKSLLSAMLDISFNLVMSIGCVRNCVAVVSFYLQCKCLNKYCASVSSCWSRVQKKMRQWTPHAIARMCCCAMICGDDDAEEVEHDDVVEKNNLDGGLINYHTIEPPGPRRKSRTFHSTAKSYASDESSPAIGAPLSQAGGEQQKFLIETCTPNSSTSDFAQRQSRAFSSSSSSSSTAQLQHGTKAAVPTPRAAEDNAQDTNDHDADEITGQRRGRRSVKQDGDDQAQCLQQLPSQSDSNLLCRSDGGDNNEKTGGHGNLDQEVNDGDFETIVHRAELEQEAEGTQLEMDGGWTDRAFVPSKLFAFKMVVLTLGGFIASTVEANSNSQALTTQWRKYNAWCATIFNGAVFAAFADLSVLFFIFYTLRTDALNLNKKPLWACALAPAKSMAEYASMLFVSLNGDNWAAKFFTRCPAARVSMRISWITFLSAYITHACSGFLIFLPFQIIWYSTAVASGGMLCGAIAYFGDYYGDEIHKFYAKRALAQQPIAYNTVGGPSAHSGDYGKSREFLLKFRCFLSRFVCAVVYSTLVIYSYTLVANWAVLAFDEPSLYLGSGFSAYISVVWDELSIRSLGCTVLRLRNEASVFGASANKIMSLL